MFDVGFSELVLLFIIGLLILGPERLPRVASQLGRWVGRARRTATQLRMQLEREMTMNEIMEKQRKAERDKAAKPSAPATGAEAAATDDDSASAVRPSGTAESAGTQTDQSEANGTNDESREP